MFGSGFPLCTPHTERRRHLYFLNKLVIYFLMSWIRLDISKASTKILAIYISLSFGN